ncbi:MAG TPA: DUF58 domain-containing protein [bacterium]|nr:DUF58 domain-containing protein [bacterium]
MANNNIFDPGLLVKFSNLPLIAKTVVEGFISGLHKSPHRGFSVEFSEHREYTPGEDLRYLDWKVFGRTDRFYVKVFREETNLKAYILLDTSNSMNYGSRSVTKLQYGVMLASILSYLMVKQKDAVGLVTFDTEVREFIKPMSTVSHLQNIFGALEKTEAGGETSLGTVLNRIALNIKKRSLIILLSDLMDDQGEIIRGLSHFRHRHNEVIVLHLLDPAEHELPFDGDCEFRDMESGERVLAGVPYVRKAYLKLMQEFLDSIRKSCGENRIEYAMTSTDVAFDSFLHSYLKSR